MLFEAVASRDCFCPGDRPSAGLPGACLHDRSGPTSALGNCDFSRRFCAFNKTVLPLGGGGGGGETLITFQQYCLRPADCSPRPPRASRDSRIHHGGVTCLREIVEADWLALVRSCSELVLYGKHSRTHARTHADGRT